MKPEYLKKTLLEDPAALAAELAQGHREKPDRAPPGDDNGGLKGNLAMLWMLSVDREESKQVKKAAKKALYLLRSRGVDVDRYRPHLGHHLQKQGREGGGGVRGDAGETAGGRRLISALLSIPDSSLNSQLILPIGGGEERALEVYAVVVSERGIRRISSSRGSRRQVERFGRENPSFLRVSSEYALSRFGGALAHSRDTLSGLSALPPVLAHAEDRSLPHPVIEESARTMTRVIPSDVEKQLFSRPEVGGLGLPEEDVAPYREQIREARSSRLIIGNQTPQERVEAVAARFYRTYFTPRRLDYCRTVLLDVALYFFRQGLHSFTGALLGYAQGLRGISVAPAAAARHPFLHYLIYRSLLSD